MEQHSNCVVCRRGLHNARYQRHVLTDDLPRTRPAFAAYIQEHAELEVSTHFVILFKCVTGDSPYYEIVSSVRK